MSEVRTSLRTGRSKAIGASLRGWVAGQMVRLVVNLDAELRVRTPYDTGWARANWIWSVGVPALATFGSRAAVSVQTSVAAVISAILAAARTGKIYVSNNVPYIVDLDEGSSQQAPRGFVRMAVRTAVASARYAAQTASRAGASL